jgi:hypothetical protein
VVRLRGQRGGGQRLIARRSRPGLVSARAAPPQRGAAAPGPRSGTEAGTAPGGRGGAFRSAPVAHGEPVMRHESPPARRGAAVDR